ncbi:MAG: hypothetical protein LBV47_07770 [Bacteroidales bacterium]|jgi:hypothetical protein|nr:hypothetical protein [Bacteroidales bacterium]
MKFLGYFFVGLVIFFVGCWLGRGNVREVVRTEIQYDTLIMHDTVVYEKPVPVVHQIVRTDTVMLEMPADTVKVLVEVPIERSEYKTDDYRAVIEGYRASLLSMEVYPKTQIITKTETVTVFKKPKLGFGIQAGYGITQNGLEPYLGVGIQYQFKIKD